MLWFDEKSIPIVYGIYTLAISYLMYLNNIDILRYNVFPKLYFSGGKRNEELILPINDSISITLNSDQVMFLNFMYIN